MREIEYRAKKVKANNWVYGYYHKLNESFENKECILEHHRNTSTIIDATTLGQFTGEKDKNNKKIYEGDILLVIPKERSIDGKDHYDYVIFSNGCFCLANAVMFYEFTYGVDNYEVVGNIYDNPDLIKESESDGRGE